MVRIIFENYFCLTFDLKYSIIKINSIKSRLKCVLKILTTDKETVKSFP